MKIPIILKRTTYVKAIYKKNNKLAFLLYPRVLITTQIKPKGNEIIWQLLRLEICAQRT